VDGNPEQAERQQKQPYERIEDERQQRYRPAQHKQKTPKQESNHWGQLLFDMIRRRKKKVQGHGAPARKLIAER
jgi:hypothetical protein